MKPIKEYLAPHKSMYSAAKHHEVKAWQLSRLVDGQARVDEFGQVWIKSKTILKVD